MALKALVAACFLRLLPTRKKVTWFEMYLLSPTLPPHTPSPPPFSHALLTHRKNTVLMILLPSSLLSQLTHSQSKYYMLLEYLSRFYRTLVSTPPWFRYLSNAHNSGAVFAVIITAAYLMIKGGVIFSRLRELFRAFVNFLQDPVSGS